MISHLLVSHIYRDRYPQGTVLGSCNAVESPVEVDPKGTVGTSYIVHPTLFPCSVRLTRNTTFPASILYCVLNCIDVAAAVKTIISKDPRAKQLGSLTSDGPDLYAVMSDPAGNVFCLKQVDGWSIDRWCGWAVGSVASV